MIRKMNFFESDFLYLISDKRDFTIVSSSNTKQIKIKDSEKKEKIFYSNEKMNMKIHHIVKKLKKELEINLSDINNFMAKKEYNYYYQNSNFGDFCAKTIYNIDISSAYLTALINKELISIDLFNEIFDLPKKDRLICLGLLAYEPVFFNYQNGILKDFEVKKNDFRNVFFYCVYEISEVIKEVVNILGDNHIFSWVDGVYFLENDFLKDIVELTFKEKKYNTKFEILTDFTLQKFENFNNFTFYKETQKKEINIPTVMKKKQIDKGKKFSEFIENPNFENAMNYLNFK